MRDPGPILIDSLDKPNAPPQGPGQPHPLTPISRRDERSTRRLPAQAWIILTVAALALLSFVLWGVYSAVQALLWEFPWVAGAMGLLLVLAACASLLALVYTLVMRLYLWVQQGRIIRSRLDVPIDAMMVLNRDPIGLEAPHLAYETAKIAAMEHPLITTWTSPQPPQAKVDAPLLLSAPIDVGPIAPDVWLGWLNLVPHVMLAAETGGGKTTTALHLLAPRLASGEQVYIIDPNASGWGGLPSIGGGENWPAVAGAMSAVIALYAQRQQQRQQHLERTRRELPHDAFGRLTVILDEAYMARAALDTGKENVWRRFVPILGSGARKVGISVILLTQTTNVEDLGISAPLRENYTRLALDSAAARKLVQAEEPDKARKAALLGQLAGLQYPAVTERMGQCVLLDRSGFDATPDLERYGRQVWAPALRCQPPTKESATLKLLAELKARGLSRDDVRQRYPDLDFSNKTWGEV